MTLWRGRVIARLLASLCLLGSCMLSPAVFAAPDADAKAAELERLRDRIEALRTELEQARGRHESVQQRLRAVEKRVGRVTRQLRQLRTRLGQQRHELANLKTERDDLEQELASQRKLLVRQVQASYVMGRQEQIKILLNQGDPGTVRRTLVYYDYVNRSRASRIREVLQNIERLETVEREIGERQKRLQALRQQREAERAALESSREQRQRILASLEARIRDKGRNLERLKRDEAELEQVVRALEKALSDIPGAMDGAEPFGQRRGQLPWPAQGRLVTRYGARRAGSMVWRGVIIKAPRGEQVRAISYGRVAFADWLRGYGLMTIVDHGDGFMTLYGHNEALYKEVGEWVVPGEVLASVGDSGGRQHDGLYFEIRHQGQPVDPVRWCRAPRGQMVGLNR